MTTFPTSAKGGLGLGANTVNNESNRRPHPAGFDVPNADVSFAAPRWPTIVFGSDPANFNYVNILEKHPGTPAESNDPNFNGSQVSFDRLFNKQNAFTFYDAANFYVFGGSGTGEKDTITPGINIRNLYPVIPDGMWFSVDVGIPSSSGSIAGRPAWSVNSAGNYNGDFEVWRCYFPVVPPRNQQGHQYERIADVGSGNENLSPGEYNATAAAAYYNFRPNFTRSGGNIRGTRVFVYYNYSGVVYASAQYDGFSGHDMTQARVYILKIQFWPPKTRNTMNFAGGGKSFGQGSPNSQSTNQIHLEYLNKMSSYMSTNPPLPPGDSMPTPANIPKENIPATAPNITTNGNDNTSSPGCFAGSARVTMYDGSTKTINKVKIGDFVKDRYGNKNEVVDIQITRAGLNNTLYSINGSKYFITKNHPIAVDDNIGYGAINPKQIYDGEFDNNPIVNYLIDSASAITKNSDIITLSGSAKVNSIRSKNVSYNTKLYNLILKDHATYIVEGIAVLSDDASERIFNELKGGLDKVIFQVVKYAFAKERKFGSNAARWFLEHYVRELTAYYSKKEQGKFYLQGAVYAGAMIFVSRLFRSFINSKENIKYKLESN